MFRESGYTLPEELPPRQRPVETELGHEGVARGRAAIERFADVYLHDLPLGVRTKEDLEHIVHNVLSRPDGLLMFTDSGAHFFNYGRSGEGKSSDRFVIELSPNDLAERYNILREKLAAKDIQLPEEQLRELIYEWVVWHELGHGLQGAYGSAARKDPRSVVQLPASLNRDTWSAGLSEPHQVPHHSTLGGLIESERFAEGFAQYLLEQEVLRLGYGEEVARALIETIRALREEKAQPARQVLEEELESERQGQKYSYEAFRAKLKARGTTINKIGYAAAYAPDTIVKILEMTRTYEDLLPEDKTITV